MNKKNDPNLMILLSKQNWPGYLNLKCSDKINSTNTTTVAGLINIDWID